MLNFKVWILSLVRSGRKNMIRGELQPNHSQVSRGGGEEIPKYYTYIHPSEVKIKEEEEEEVNEENNNNNVELEVELKKDHLEKDDSPWEGLDPPDSSQGFSFEISSMNHLTIYHTKCNSVRSAFSNRCRNCGNNVS